MATKKSTKKSAKRPPVAGRDEPVRGEATEPMEVMEFFPGQKVKVQLLNWGPRNSPAKEFRLHLDLSIALSLVHSMAPQIAAGFQSVATLDNGIPKCGPLDVTLDPLTIRAYATPQTRSAAAVWPAAVLNGLVVARPSSQSKKDPSDVELRFSTTVKVSDEQLVWVKNHTGKYFFAEFEVTQGKLIAEANRRRSPHPINGKASGDEDEDEPMFPGISEPPTGKDAAAGSDN